MSSKLKLLMEFKHTHIVRSTKMAGTIRIQGREVNLKHTRQSGQKLKTHRNAQEYQSIPNHARQGKQTTPEQHSTDNPTSPQAGSWFRPGDLL